MYKHLFFVSSLVRKFNAHVCTCSKKKGHAYLRHTMMYILLIASQKYVSEAIPIQHLHSYMALLSGFKNWLNTWWNKIFSTGYFTRKQIKSQVVQCNILRKYLGRGNKHRLWPPKGSLQVKGPNQSS